MNLTPDRGEMLRALATQGFTPAESAGLLDGSLTPMGVFDFQHARLNFDGMSKLRRALATSPSLKRMAAQPIVGAIALGMRTWARKAAKRDLLHRETAANVVTTEGLNHILSVVLNNGTKVSPWYVALFEGNYTPVAGLTAATFTSAATECTAYDEASRVEYNEDAPSGGVISNSTNRAVFTINASKTLYGGALLSVATKSSTSGVCLAAARFSSSRAVVDDDEISIRYTLTLTSS